MLNPVSLYDYYYNAVLKDLTEYTLEKQLKELHNSKILVLDYSGMVSNYAELFLLHKVQIFIVENEYEDISSIVLGYDVIYLLSFKSQVIRTNFQHIRMIFDENKYSFKILDR